jgi:hypothetical protein
MNRTLFDHPKSSLDEKTSLKVRLSVGQASLLGWRPDFLSKFQSAMRPHEL